MPAWALQARTLLAALIGGFIASYAHIPLPWMIGPMVAVAALAWSHEVAVPKGIRQASLVVLGLGLGQTFSGPVLAAVAGALPALVVAGVLTIMSGLVVARIFMHLASTDAKTGYFSAVPGGVTVMAVLAHEAGASVPAVTLAQTLRMVCVVLIFPPLLVWVVPHTVDSTFVIPRPEVHLPGLAALVALGGALAYGVSRFGLANPWMLGPCVFAIILSAFDILPSGVPVWLVDAAQLGMGASPGVRLTRKFLLSSRRLAIASLLSSLVLCVLLTLLAIGLGWAFGLPVAAAILGMAPGGMPEMTITAKALELAVPLVLGFHLVRVILCNLLIGPIWRLGLWLKLV
ncbi:AbrB family transcriptional regulator [Acetobacteraceae bacterium H6797]|nr:AbrB family transcriptional regulator [Acetobacteraceae bacterium H6797]